MLELYSSLLRQNYKATYIATPKQCDKIIKPIVNVPSCSVSLQDDGTASHHRWVSVIMLSYLYLSMLNAVVTYKYIKVHILTRIKVCSFFVWLGFPKSSHTQAIIHSILWNGREEDLPKSLPLSPAHFYFFIFGLLFSAFITNWK